MIQKITKTGLIVTIVELKTKSKVVVSNKGINKIFLQPILCKH
jgi:hypothetical protein